jgi:hypothetical protein
LVRKIKVTLVVVTEERQNRLQDSCVDNGNNELYNVRKLLSPGQCHFASLPKDRDGTSVMALRCPAMWRVVKGEA